MSDFPWVKNFPPGIRWDTPVTVTSVPQVLDAAVKKFAQRPAIEFVGRTMTYGELGELVDRATAGLQSLGVGPGVHVGLYLPNCPQYYICFYAILKAGGTVVNYSPLDAERVIRHKIEDSETDLMITLDLAAFLPQTLRMLGTTRIKKVVVSGLDEFSGNPGHFRAQLKQAGQLAEWPNDKRVLRFADLLIEKNHAGPSSAIDPWETIAVLQYTGGTTGEPKAAMLTHANLTAAAEQHLASVKGDKPVLDEGKERALATLPLFHIFALNFFLLFCVRLGAHVLLRTKFEVDEVVDDLATRQITIFPGVPTMFTAIVNHPKASALNLRSLKYCGSGGAPLPVEVTQRFFELTGCLLCEGWGMTETAPTGTLSPVHAVRKIGSCGMPAPGVTLKIVSLQDAETELTAGQKGELCIAGPNVMKGYWRNAASTAASFTSDGFFRTGDIAYMDDDGYFFIVDRTKDMILCSGYNVYPRLIEEAIYEHPSVEEVCVIGVPDEYRGQSPKAFIKLKVGAAGIELEEMKEFLKERLGKHEMIQEMEIRDQLPKTAVGKQSKKDLVAEEQLRRGAHENNHKALQ